jgi:hypothetical protein
MGALMFDPGNGNGARRVKVDDGIDGIVLEQWTLSCGSTSFGSRESSIIDLVGDGTTGPIKRERPTYIPPSSSSAYKSGIIHFRSLYQFIRLSPTYSLYRRLKRKGGALKIGIKIWCAEGWDGEYRVPKGTISDASTEDEGGGGGGGGGGATGGGLRDAWQKMESGLIGLEDGLCGGGGDAEIDEYTFPSIMIGNGVFTLSCRSRKVTNFWIEDPEAALSTGFAREDANAAAMTGFDLEEEYFTPTLSKRRTDSGSSDRPASLPNDGLKRTMAGLSATRPTELEVQRRRSIEGEAAKEGDPAASSTGSLRRWANLGEGLPFAIPQGQSRPNIDRLRTSSLSGRVSFSDTLANWGLAN